MFSNPHVFITILEIYNLVTIFLSLSFKRVVLLLVRWMNEGPKETSKSTRLVFTFSGVKQRSEVRREKLWKKYKNKRIHTTQ